MQIKPVSRLSSTDRHEMTVLSPSLLAEHARFKPKGRWRGGFTVAAWIRFPEGLNERVQLMLTYRDSERRKTYLIDRCLPNGQSLILLNGAVDLNVYGEVTEMSLYLKGLHQDAVWMLDECHMTPKQRAVAGKTPLQRAN